MNKLPSMGVPEREFVKVYSMSGQFGSDFSQEIFVINCLAPVEMSYLNGKTGLLMM